MDLSQYSIVLVNLDPTIGSEIKKTRLCVIISPNEMNKYLNTIILAPMTTNLKKYPTRVHVNHGLSSFVGTNFSEQNHLKNYDKKSLQHRI